MKIKKIKIQDHKIFNDIELDFTDIHGKASNLIVLAGVNGSGKTTIFQLISKLFSESSNIFRLNKPIPIREFNLDPDSIMCKKIEVNIELADTARRSVSDLLSDFLCLSKKVETTNDDKVPTQLKTLMQKLNRKSTDITFEYELKILDDKVEIIKNDFLLFAILS